MKPVFDHNGEVIGHECTCGAIHKWPLYVFAHWGEMLSFICPECGVDCAIQGGRIFKGFPKKGDIP